MPDSSVTLRRHEAHERAAALRISRPVRVRCVRPTVLHRVRPTPAAGHGHREVHGGHLEGASNHAFGNGSSRRDYTFIEDIVAGTVAAIERVTPGAFEIFNLGGTKTISLAELVETIEHVVGKRALIERQPDQPGDVPITYANIDRAREALGYAPTTRPDVGIARYWAWLTSR